MDIDIRCAPNTLGRISLSALHPLELEHVMLFLELGSMLYSDSFGVLYKHSSFGRKVVGWKFGECDCIL
jgi:hypothetical protein